MYWTPPLRLIIVLIVFFSCTRANAQLVVTGFTTAQELAQKLVGDGVTISNVTYTGNTDMPGFFNNLGGTNINIDSGIVLTNGRAQSRPPFRGLVGASGLLADNQFSAPGDPLLTALAGSSTNDACVLEFDFVPLGDSIRFNYVFSSEEYPEYVCQFNDVFAFFISGPGITGLQNIALIPGTNYPVTINFINNVGACSPNPTYFPQYYVNNSGNPFFTHDGHTTILTALARVMPCETYHLKIAIADAGDDAFDSGVFLQAKSLSSNIIEMENLTQTNPNGESYLVEGCATGSFHITRPHKDPSPLVVQLSYTGSATNGIDYQPLPTSVTIPANDSFIVVNVVPIIDGVLEGMENVVVYALAGCTAGLPTDSTIIQIWDYDTLSVYPGSQSICRNASIQLNASGSYSVYQWIPDPTLSNINIRNPIATPLSSPKTYICTATEGTCNARDSIRLEWKQLEFISKTDINCRNGTTGSIQADGGSEWGIPSEYSLDGISWQPAGNFNNLPAGTYWVKIRDAGCIDSVQVTLVQAFPDLVVTNLSTQDASCSGAPDGQLTITVTGGNSIYSYSIDGINFQSSPTFNVAGGSYVITIKDGNGCTITQNGTIPLNNIVTVDAGADKNICEGTSYLIPAVSNASGFSWSPSATLDNATLLTPTASPAIDTKYYITATQGICSRVDSVMIYVWPAPVADAGADFQVCFGKTIQLNGSGGVEYQWAPTTNFTTASNIPNPSLRAKESLTYYLTVKDARGCVSLSSDGVDVDVTPAVKIFAGNDTIASINQPIQLLVKELGTAGIIQYNWSPGTFLNNPTIAAPIATLPYDYRYIVTATTSDGCEGMDDIFIKVYKGPEIYVPGGFTPNNNGLNDLLRPIPVGIKEFKYFRVFNRWGQMVFVTSDPKKGWDGRINGVDQLTGTYVWTAEAIDFKGNLISRKGVVTIIR